MKKLAVANAMRWMLAAWTLWASSFASPNILHEHPGGGNPHQHDEADLLSNTHAHSIAHEAVASGCESGGFFSAADLHQHRYLLLLGAVKYLPMPTEPVGRHGDSPCGGETTIVAVSTAPGLRACSNGGVAGHFGLVPLANLAVGCICPSGRREVPPSDVAPGSLLCDRARHERSGVLLA